MKKVISFAIIIAVFSIVFVGCEKDRMYPVGGEGIIPTITTTSDVLVVNELEIEFECEYEAVLFNRDSSIVPEPNNFGESCVVCVGECTEFEDFGDNCIVSVTGPEFFINDGLTLDNDNGYLRIYKSGRKQNLPEGCKLTILIYVPDINEIEILGSTKITKN